MVNPGQLSMTKINTDYTTYIKCYVRECMTIELAL